MSDETMDTSRLGDFESAGRFYPTLHAFITAATLQYQPKLVTVAQIKAIALLQTAGQSVFACACGDFRARAKDVCDHLSIKPSTLKQICGLRMADGAVNLAMFQIRPGDIDYAAKMAKQSPAIETAAKVILACGWGIFLIPGKWLESELGHDWHLRFTDFIASPSRQVAVFCKLFDKLLATANGDFELAASMFFAGHTQPTRTEFGKRARVTLNRLIAGGHAD